MAAQYVVVALKVENIHSGWLSSGKLVAPKEDNIQAGGGGEDRGTGAADGAVRGCGARHGGGRERQAGKPAKAHGAVRHAGGRGIFRRTDG